MGESVLDDPFVVHGHGVVAVGLALMVLLAQRMEVAEHGQSSQSGIVVVEGDDVVDFGCFGASSTAGHRACLPFGGQGLPDPRWNVVAHGVGVDRGSCCGIGEDPRPRGAFPGDPACRVGRDRRTVGKGAGQVGVSEESEERHRGDHLALRGQPVGVSGHGQEDVDQPALPADVADEVVVCAVTADAVIGAGNGTEGRIGDLGARSVLRVSPTAGKSVSAGSGSDVGAVSGDACPGSGKRPAVAAHRGVRRDADRLGGCGDPLGDIGDVADAFEVERQFAGADHPGVGLLGANLDADLWAGASEDVEHQCRDCAVVLDDGTVGDLVAERSRVAVADRLRECFDAEEARLQFCRWPGEGETR